jgi:phosphoribosylamine--glycine ligase
MTAQGAKVLEYNTRFGDPECQPLLMRLESDIVPIMQACINGTLAQCPVRYSQQSALGVVLAAKGYPASYPKAMPISGIADADALQGVKVFHSGTTMNAEGVVSANGGRVLCVTALGDTLADAQARAYQALEKISMPESQHRTDIGAKGIRRLAQGN